MKRVTRGILIVKRGCKVWGQKVHTERCVKQQ